MIDILFRAKTKMIVGTYNCGKDDGEWVVGFIYDDVGKWILRQFEYKRADYVSYEVDPETICRYTGLTDKKGKYIFEGDIVVNKKNGCVGKIEWNERDAGFNLYILIRNGIFDVKHLHDYINDIEIIGNIFDNPELLEVR